MDLWVAVKIGFFEKTSELLSVSSNKLVNSRKLGSKSL